MSVREQRLARLERELAVRRLVDRYAHSCDNNDAELAASLFDDDGELVISDITRHGAEIVEFYTERFTIQTLHFTSGLTLAERSDGLVESTCGLIAIEMTADGWTGVAGRYRDLIRVDGDGARFVRRAIDVRSRLSS